MSYDPPPAIPVEDLGIEGGRCSECNKVMEEAVYIHECHYCEECSHKVMADIENDAREFALEQRRITSDLPEYDFEGERKCTREEYAAGERVPISPNSYICECRHCHTNYDDLLESLDRYEWGDGVYHDELQRRVHELIIDNLDRRGLPGDRHVLSYLDKEWTP